MSGHSRSYQVPRAPLHAQGVTSCAEVSRTLVSRHYPAFIAHTDSCVNPKSSHRLRITPSAEVFAGCCQPLLEVGPSRRYLCESFSTCLDPYPGCSCGALTHFFPQDNGLPGSMSRSALQQYPHSNFCVGDLSRLQLFVYLQARRFARHPDCSHRCTSRYSGGRGFYVPAYLGSLPPRAGDMLTVRIGQLTVEGLSPSKIRSLVGCSQQSTHICRSPLYNTSVRFLFLS